METPALYTLVILKPECIENCIVGPVMSYFDNIGLRPVAIKLSTPSEGQIRSHYREVIRSVGAEVGDSIVRRMTRGDCIFIIYTSKLGDAVTGARSVLGATDPKVAAAGTIRNHFGGSIQYNIAHASDSAESADREIGIWFPGERFLNVPIPTHIPTHTPILATTHIPTHTPILATTHTTPTDTKYPYSETNHYGC
jgi:nucleoside-diphosphate kinase